MRLAPRLLGLGTAAVGGLVLARPDLVRLVSDVDDERALALIAGVVGVRDVATGLAMLTMPRGRALRLVLVSRALLDAGDGVIFARLAASPSKQQLVRLSGFGFAAICAAVAVGERGGRVS